MNPATFLRVLGPEPWNVAYVEPSARPDDGRFGENPNRLYTHTQYQVILKPSPERSQDLYLESLAAVGIDYRKHDIRFVEDNWAQPAIGAWGLGWEVWIDGLEITQYTYFQQVGGVTLNPVPLELTYGLERIAMFLQGTRTVFDLKWDDVCTYGDVKFQDEVERSQYAFNFADVEELHDLFDKYEREGKRALAAGVVLPAHDYVLNMSNTFNLLDTRGAIGVTERARAMGRVRDLAQQVAQAYVAQRETMGHPWLKQLGGKPVGPWNSETAKATAPLSHWSAAPLLFEIGVEELPADDVPKAQEQLGALLTNELKAARIDHGPIQLFATPRRVAALVADVASSQRPLNEWVKGPGVKVAFDAQGQPTPAAIGFAKRSGVDVADLVQQQEGNATYVFARKSEAGKPAAEVLTQILPSVLSKISFEKTMRWNASNVAFARPLQWFVALLGANVIGFDYAEVTSGRISHGPRGAGSPAFEIDHASNYQTLLTNHHIIANMDARKAEIVRQLEHLAASVGGRVVADANLLDEVTNLVEQPTAVLGHIDAEYMHVPTPVLTTVMRKHQRYFSIVNAQGELQPHFVAVRNGPSADVDLVRAGNEGVLRARFADANYFFKRDMAQPLESFVPKLALLTFQAKLGSMLDKTKRIEQLVEPIASSLIPHPSSLRTAQRAAHLCKADLVTSMVIDFTSLQGAMGREYLLRQGGDATIAQAIAEHYLPRYAGDAVAQSEAGIIVALADKLDSIAGLFAVGLAPKGNADPFALRRAAIGVVQTLIENKLSFSVRNSLFSAMQLLPVKWDKAALDAAHTFILERARVVLSEQGLRHDVVEAAMNEQGDNPAAAHAAALQLQAAVQGENWAAVLAAYARCARITKGKDLIDASAISKDDEPSVQALAKALRALPPANYVNELVENLAVLVGPINTFFEKVMVMSDDAAQRNARIAVLQQVVAQAHGLADLSKVEGF
jgi:glycyl-tRNA synthetase